MNCQRLSYKERWQCAALAERLDKLNLFSKNGICKTSQSVSQPAPLIGEPLEKCTQLKYWQVLLIIEEVLFLCRKNSRS